MDDKPKLESWNMDDPEPKSVDPQLVDIQQNHAFQAAQAKMGNAMAKEKADDADTKEQYAQIASTNPLYFGSNHDIIGAVSVIQDVVSIKPRSKWYRLSDNLLVRLTTVTTVFVLVALFVLFIKG